MHFWGAIVNKRNAQQYFWEAATLAQVQADLRTLQGTTYNVHWQYAGDCPFEECNVFCEETQAVFEGTSAVQQLLAL